MAQNKRTYSDHISIQGLWHPHVHSDPEVAIADYPSEDLSKARNLPPSATENLLKINERTDSIVETDSSSQLEMSKNM